LVDWRNAVDFLQIQYWEGSSKKQKRLGAKDQGGHGSSILKEEILPDKRLSM
jgi:hypothetical protein